MATIPVLIFCILIGIATSVVTGSFHYLIGAGLGCFVGFAIGKNNDWFWGTKK